MLAGWLITTLVPTRLDPMASICSGSIERIQPFCLSFLSVLILSRPSFPSLHFQQNMWRLSVQVAKVCCWPNWDRYLSLWSGYDFGEKHRIHDRIGACVLGRIICGMCVFGGNGPASYPGGHMHLGNSFGLAKIESSTWLKPNLGYTTLT